MAAQIIREIDHSCKCNAFGDPLGMGGDRAKLSAGVICTYAAQSKLVRDYLEGEVFGSFRGKGDEEEFMVKSVDDFQGDERDIIVLSIVRTGGSFIQDYRRINVAMSRARRLLIILGNGTKLSEATIGLEGADGTPRESHAYKDIIDEIRHHGGYRTVDQILGGDEE